LYTQFFRFTRIKPKYNGVVSKTQQINIDRADRLLLRVEEAGEMIGIRRAKAYAMASSGELPGVIRIGRCVRVSAEALRNWVTEQVEAGTR
jgi:excisionase family DNA binding protein